jgi:hypothetical protein
VVADLSQAERRSVTKRLDKDEFFAKIRSSAKWSIGIHEESEELLLITKTHAGENEVYLGPEGLSKEAYVSFLTILDMMLRVDAARLIDEFHVKVSTMMKLDP